VSGEEEKRLWAVIYRADGRSKVRSRGRSKVRSRVAGMGLHTVAGAVERKRG